MDYNVQKYLTEHVGPEGLPILNQEDWTFIHTKVEPDDFREELAEWIVTNKPPYPRKVSLQNPQKADNKFLGCDLENFGKIFIILSIFSFSPITPVDDTKI